MLYNKTYIYLIKKPQETLEVFNFVYFCNIKFCEFSDKVHGVLSITKLDSVFDYFETVDEALKSYE